MKVQESLQGLCYSVEWWLSSLWHKECSSFMEMSCRMLAFETKGTCGNGQRVDFEYIYDWHIFRCLGQDCLFSMVF
jgi:hypothetical protein